MSEAKLQSKIFQFTWNNHPNTRGLIFHVPNGGFRKKREANTLKATGVIAGIPDLLFIWKGTLHAFELKAQSGRVSASQLVIHEKWKEHRIETHIIRSMDQFKTVFNEIIKN